MKQAKIIGLGFVLILAFVFIGCGEEENPFIGSWSGTVAFSGMGASAIINVTETNWTFSSPTAQMLETGTYTWSGNSATLTQLGFTFGTATVSGNSLTVNIITGDFAGGIGTFSK